MHTAETFYNTIAKSYDRRFLSDVALIENALATAYLPTRNVLDLGCGTGLYLEYCQPSSYVGLDISTEMLRIAQSKFPQATFVHGDMAAIPLPDASVDTVVSLFGSFSYCLTPHRCVSEICRVLRPGGRVVIMVMGQRYFTRKSHIAHGVLPIMTYTAKQLRYLFAPIGPVSIRGLNWQLERFPRRWYARLEHEMISRLFPDACYFLIAEMMKCRRPVGDCGV